MHGRTRWRTIGPNGDLLRLLGGLMDQFQSDHPELVPDISQSTKLVLSSDYSGQHDLATHKVYSFLLASVDQSEAWQLARDQLRERLPDGRRMSYKDLRDKVRWKALPEFMEAANQITGVLATFLVDRRFHTLLPSLANEQISALLPKGFSTPTPAVFEDMVRIAHFMTFLIAGLVNNGQGVQWITDEDAIVGNSARRVQMRTVLGTVSGAYAEAMPQLAYFKAGSTDSPDPTRIIEDFASIPDLAAGALAAYFQDRPELLAGLQSGVLVPPTNMAMKTFQLLGWIAKKTAPLKRWTFILSPTDAPGHSLWVGLLRIVGVDDVTQ